MKILRLSKRVQALTLIEVTVIVVVIAILALIFIPAIVGGYNEQRARDLAVTCQKNLHEMGIAFRSWGNDHADRFPMNDFSNHETTMQYSAGGFPAQYFREISSQLTDLHVLICPSDNRKTAVRVGRLDNKNVSYFLGLNADESDPAMLLAGDRNLATNGVAVIPGLVIIGTNSAAGWTAKMHNTTGNFLLADGSVQHGTSRGFQVYISRTGTNANRLAVP